MAQKLKTMGYAPINITEVKTSGMSSEITIPRSGSKVKLKDLAIFTRQFATMINSGLPLLRGLRILEEQTESKHLKTALSAVRADVEAGTALSLAMGQPPEGLPAAHGQHDACRRDRWLPRQVLLQIAENYEAEVKLRGKVKAAMTYPVVVFIMAILAMVAMLLFIVPVFAKLFSSLGGTLPAPTRVLIFYLGHPQELRAVPDRVPDRGVHRLETRQAHGEGPTGRRPAEAEAAGVRQPLPEDRAQPLRPQPRHPDELRRADPAEPRHRGRHDRQRGRRARRRDVQESVRRGESLSAPLAMHAVFPPMVVQMMAVGEDTGALDAMLHKITQFYDQEVEATTEALTALIEPLMIAFLGHRRRVDGHRALHAHLQDLRPDQLTRSSHGRPDPAPAGPGRSLSWLVCCACHDPWARLRPSG